MMAKICLKMMVSKLSCSSRAAAAVLGRARSSHALELSRDSVVERGMVRTILQISEAVNGMVSVVVVGGLLVVVRWVFVLW